MLLTSNQRVVFMYMLCGMESTKLPPLFQAGVCIANGKKKTLKHRITFNRESKQIIKLSSSVQLSIVFPRNIFFLNLP